MTTTTDLGATKFAPASTHRRKGAEPRTDYTTLAGRTLAIAKLIRLYADLEAKGATDTQKHTACKQAWAAMRDGGK